MYSVADDECVCVYASLSVFATVAAISVRIAVCTANLPSGSEITHF